MERLASILGHAISLVEFITTAIITTIAGTTVTDRPERKTARVALTTGGRATAAPALQLSFDVRLVVQNDIQQGRETRSLIG